MNIFSILIPFFVTITLLLVFLKTPLSTLALDKPNARSLHTHHTPRTGGLALMLGVIVACLITSIDGRWILLILVLMGVSLIDDLRGLPVCWRLLAQVLVSLCFVWFFTPNLVWWLIPVALLGLVWMTNLYNFMDGADGLASGMTAFGFGAYAIAAYSAQNILLAQMCSAIVASSLAFLIFNFHPAKIFMGDSGSIPLGFLAGAIGLFGWQQGVWPYWFPILVFSPFIFDATATLIKRGVRGEKVWLAHREHYYQRLVLMGWGHKKTAITAYILMFLVCFSALLLLKTTFIIVSALLAFWTIIYMVLMYKIDKQWKLHLSKQ